MNIIAPTIANILENFILSSLVRIYPKAVRTLSLHNAYTSLQYFAIFQILDVVPASNLSWCAKNLGLADGK